MSTADRESIRVLHVDDEPDFAELAAAFLEREREIEDRKAKIEALHAVTTDLVSRRTETDVYELTVDAAERILDLDMCNVGIVEGEVVVPRAWSADMNPEHTRPMRVDEGMVGKTFQTGTSYLIDELGEVAEAKPTAEGYRSAISVPIGDFGVFQAVSMEASEFDETDLELIETFIATVVATIERIERETQLRDREAKLDAERDRFETLFEYIPDPAVTVSLSDGEAITRSVNVAFEDVFGYDTGTIVGEPINDFIVPPDGIENARAIDRTAMEKNQVIEEVRRRTANGEVRDFLFRNVPIEGDGEDEAFGIYTDITDRREYERTLERQNERLEEFASVVSHDLRNPLGVAQGYLTLLEAGDEEILGKIHNAHDRMERIVEDG